MRKLLISVALMLSAITMGAQSEITRAEIQARIDYTQEYINGNNVGANSGFNGKQLMFRMDGTLAEGFTYSFRQRVNRPTQNSSLFDATDWLNVTYTKGPWSFSGGKQIVAIGGYEYDHSPIDLFFCSEYWYHIACFQFAVSGSYEFNDSKDKLTFQISESPFRRDIYNPMNDNLLAYNLMLTETQDWYQCISSANLFEYAPGKYICYVALGYRFEFNDLALEIDFTDKYCNSNNAFSVVGNLVWSANDSVNLFAKCTYDYNQSVVEDICVPLGTDLYRAGAGVEYFPIRNNKNLRLHLNYCYTDGKSTSANALRPQQSIFDAGLTWKIDLIKR